MRSASPKLKTLIVRIGAARIRHTADAPSPWVPDGLAKICHGLHAIGSVNMGLQIDLPSRLGLFIPHPESRLSSELAHGSAIVGLPLDSGAIRIYYEGNVIGASNL